MKGKKAINSFLIDYKKKNKEFNILNIVSFKNGFKMLFNDGNIFVICDKDLGWHCYSDMKNHELFYKIERNLENYFNRINILYYN